MHSTSRTPNRLRHTPSVFVACVFAACSQAEAPDDPATHETVTTSSTTSTTTATTSSSTTSASTTTSSTSSTTTGTIPPVFAQCGNGVCEPGETQACADCPIATATCNDGTCDFGETSTQCPLDCRPLVVGGAPVPGLPDLGANRWKNYVGGLYPDGENELPPDHLAAGRAAAHAIEPLDTSGQPSAAGKIVVLSVGMSNTTQEFCAHDGVNDNQASACRPWTFSGRARDDVEVDHGALTLVNGARGGMSAENWTSPPAPHVPPATSACQAGGYANPNNAVLYPNTPAGQAERAGVFGPNLVFDEEYDRINACNLKANGLSYLQVQVAWVKLSRADPGASMLPDANADAYNLKRDLGNVMRTLKARYPNLAQVFLSSRIWGGNSGSSTAEPYAFETGFAVKWLIEAQMNQMRNGGQPTEDQAAPGACGDLDYETGVAPWLAWGPYLWSDGFHPGSGGAAWFGDVAGELYAQDLASESSPAFAQSLTLPANNGGNYYVACGAGVSTATPGPERAVTTNRWCDSDFFTLAPNGSRVNAGFPAQYGWASDYQQEDGTHPTHDGEAKVGTLLLHFFKSSPVTSCWFLAGGSCP